MRSFEATALTFHAACEKRGIRYAFIGGLAVNAWGIPRNTADIDVLIRLRPDEDAAFAESLRAEGLAASAEDSAAARDDRSHVTVFDDAGSIQLDLKICRGILEDEQVLAAVEIVLGGGRLCVARPEDTVAFKLKFGTPQDLADARGILARQGATSTPDGSPASPFASASPRNCARRSTP